MNAISIEGFDTKALGNINLEGLKQKLDSVNSKFPSLVKPENGAYGVEPIEKGNGLQEYRTKNELNRPCIDTYQDGKHVFRREKTSDVRVKKTFYDDNETAYLTEEVNYRHNYDGHKNLVKSLIPNTTVIKNNFTAVIDSYGRPILNKITDAKVRDGARKNIKTERNEGFDRGHLIADLFDAPSTAENVVDQLPEVNRSEFRKLEEVAKKYINDDHKVDIEVKTNYTDRSNRASSFDYKIIVDGEEKVVQKIYNAVDPSKIDILKTTAKEKMQKMDTFIKNPNDVGKKTGLEAAAITCAVSTVDNVTDFIQGDIEADEMVINIVKDTGVAGVAGYATGFVNTAVAQAMKASSHELLSKLGSTGIPAMVVSFGVETYDTVIDFSTGKIDGKEFAYDMGAAAVKVAVGAGAVALTGVALSTAAVPAGVVGVAVNVGAPIVASMVGTIVATEAYATAVETGTAGAEKLLSKAQDLASTTIEQVKSIAPNQVSSIKEAISNFGNNIGVKLV